MIRSIGKTLVLAAGVTLLALSLIAFPKEAFEASKVGLDMWWKIVFPSLLPFFIVSELLIGFGVVKFVGVLLEPLMRPLFRVPGVGGFVWAMGMASGYPAGAKLTARLRQEKQLTAIEAERLVSFTNASNPLFIFSAIAVGFFNNPQLGIILALAHYLGNMCVGLIMRFHGKDEKKATETENQKRPTVVDALRALHRTRIKEKRPFGKLLGDAVTSSIQTLLMIGGFIIIFSVFNKLLALVSITEGIAYLLSFIFNLFHLPTELSVPLISGLFEITLGGKLTSQADASLLQQLIITSFILAFSGFSVQAQVASILAETDIRFKPFFIARIMHGFLAAIISVLLWKPIYLKFLDEESISPGPIMSVFLQNESQLLVHYIWNGLLKYGPLITIGSLTIYIILYSRRLKSPRY